MSSPTACIPRALYRIHRGHQEEEAPSTQKDTATTTRRALHHFSIIFTISKGTSQARVPY